MKRQGTVTVSCCLVALWCALPGLAKEESFESKSPSLKWLGVEDVLVTDPSVLSIQPSMASAPNGDLFVAVDIYATNSIEIFESTDGGKSWSSLFWISDGSDSRHPSVAYAEGPGDEKWIYVAYEKVNADDTREVWVARIHRTVPGFIWSRAKVGGPWSMGSSSEHIQPRITTDYLEFGVIHYVYVTYTVKDGGKYPIHFSRSLDLGLTWSIPTDVSGGSVATTWLPRPDVAFGKAGLFIAFVKPGWTGSTIANQIWLAKSPTAGESWLSPVQLTSSEDNQYHPVVSAAHDRNSVLVVYTRDDSTDTDLECAFTTDGHTWTEDQPVYGMSDDERYADVEASLDVDDPGWFHLAYHRTIDASPGIWYTRSATSDPGGWISPSHTRVDESGAISSGFPRPVIAVDPTISVTAAACVTWTDVRTGTYGAFFAREWPIFTDGFESANTSLWSTTVGGP
jgi:hypothetical protein